MSAPPTPAAPERLAAADPACVFPESGPCQLPVSACSLLGTDGPDTLIGGPTADLICGLAGDDRLTGGGGDDTLAGGPGDDTLIGETGSFLGPAAKNCLLGGSGRNTFPDADPDEIVQQGRRAGRVHVDDNGRCRQVIIVLGIVGPGRIVVEAGGGGGREQGSGGGEQGGGGGEQGGGGGAQGGGISVPVTTGSLVLTIATLLEPARESTGFPVALVSTGRAQDGVAKLLLRCPDSAVSGTLTLTMRQAGRWHRVGRSNFDCDPPTEVATVQLNRAAQNRLAHSGRLVLRTRIRVDGGSGTLTERLTIRSDED